MKKFLKVAAFGLFALAFLLFPDQVSAAAHSVDGLALITDPLFHSPTGVSMGVTTLLSLGNLDGTSYQEPNPGGIRRLFLALKRDIAGVWPKLTDIVNGEITTAPTMKTGKTFSEYEAAPDTSSLDDDDAGDPGFQSYKHVLEFMIAGINATKTAELRKHLNAGGVVIAELNDGQYVVGGSSDNPIFLKKGFKSGKKGSDKRGFTVKGEQDGFMWGVMPLAPAAVALLALEPIDE